jgi:hypothetical protein
VKLTIAVQTAANGTQQLPPAASPANDHGRDQHETRALIAHLRMMFVHGTEAETTTSGSSYSVLSSHTNRTMTGFSQLFEKRYESTKLLQFAKICKC